MSKLRKLMVALALLFAAPAMVAPAGAQPADYPSRPIKIIVCLPPGGGVDTVTRIISEPLQRRLGQPIVIENKGGQSGNIGAEAVFNADPDGYTLLASQPAPITTNPLLYRSMSFDPAKFAPVAVMTRIPNTLTVRADFPAKTVQEFIDYVKANPGKVNMASSGNGTSVHLSGELFMAMTGIKMTHVPYRGSNPALTDLMGGQVHVLFDNMPSSIELIRGGKIRALAVTTEKRASYFPNVPTVAETVKGYEASAWFGMGAKAGTSPEIIAYLNKQLEAALADPKIAARIADLGGAPMGGTPADFGKIIAAETEKWKKVVEFSGAKVE